MDRRRFLRNTAAAGLGAGIGLPFELAAAREYDAFTNIARLTAPGLFAGNPLVRLAQTLAPRALADTQGSDWSLVTIKVLNHVFTPLVFAPGQITGGTNVLSPQIVRASTRAGAAAAALTAAGVDRLSDKPRYAKLRFNQWFADMLHFGTADGKPSATALPVSGVALQTFHHLKQIGGQNHALKGTKLRADLPDLALFAEAGGLVQSPLGISALMMGGEYDKAEGALAANAVLAAADAEAIVVPSRRIADYVGQLGQFVSQTYASREPLATNLSARFDRLVQATPKLRKELLDSVAAFKASLSRFEAVSALEAKTQAFDAGLANGQSSVSGNGASFEFLAQCRYVLECLALPGRPLRNFSLFLNINDLDGKDLDATVNNPNPDQNGAGVRAFTYIEGMRQLATGLNVLGRRIAAGEKLIVTVVSEGGRGAAMEDSKTSFALVMGPGGAGGLADALYANNAEWNKQDSVVLRDLAAETAQIPWDIDGGLRTKSGAKLPGTVATIGDVQMGVVQFLEQATQKNTRDALSEEDGRYAYLKRS